MKISWHYAPDGTLAGHLPHGTLGTLLLRKVAGEWWLTREASDGALWEAPLGTGNLAEAKRRAVGIVYGWLGSER